MGEKRERVGQDMNMEQRATRDKNAYGMKRASDRREWQIVTQVRTLSLSDGRFSV
jgi:hypothetical protein